jgi:preprotein translocase subunit SecY
MLDYIRKLWKIEDLRKKIVYTFVMLLLFRLVGCIPAPGIDLTRLGMGGTDLPLLDMMNMMTGGAMSQMTIMAMGISPYINSSIIMQLLCIALPVLERMQQEEGGREKINRISRYVTIALAVIQAIGLSNGLGYAKDGLWNNILIGVSMAGGTALAMWIGERITEKGIGNGISLLIFAGIVSNLFNGIVINGFINAPTVTAVLGGVAMLVLLLVLTLVVTYVDLGERRIPLQIAKQVKGRRVYGGQSTHMSLKVVSVGVLPLIFAYSFLAFPGTIAQLIDPQMNGWFTQWWTRNMYTGSVWYMIISALLIIAFTFFYSSISFDPKKQAEQLQQQGAVIPGQRGKNIRQYLQNIMNRLNLFAALFLAVLAAVPTLLLRLAGVQVPFAASSILIAVSVSLETIRTIQGEMSVRGIDMDMEDVGFM